MATYLLYLVAAIQVINALITFAIAGDLTDAARDAYAGTDAEGAESFVSVVFIGGAVINLLLGAGFAVLGFFDSRGKNPARIVTWVIGGISLCCFGASLGSTALVGAVDTGGTTTGGPTEAEVQRRLDDAMPGWFSSTTTTLSVLALLAILGTIILLALPAANEFFRKRTSAAWDPSTPYPPYPGGYGPPSGGPGYGAPGAPGYGQPGGAGYGAPGSSGPGAFGGSGPGASGGSGYGQPGYPSYPSYPGQQGQPGQPAPGLPPYPGATPPQDPYAPPPPPPSGGDQPPKPPTDPA
ncbi:hypothetical protein [Actinoplanes sp. URMC 104]|uniref:hypothetical protein n=1 Tax=Actinoplanes sp. URMC 104 TaxID=3423409 RepID=UPI003F1D216F